MIALVGIIVTMLLSHSPLLSSLLSPFSSLPQQQTQRPCPWEFLQEPVTRICSVWIQPRQTAQQRIGWPHQRIICQRLRRWKPSKASWQGLSIHRGTRAAIKFSLRLLDHDLTGNYFMDHGDRSAPLKTWPYIQYDPSRLQHFMRT